MFVPKKLEMKLGTFSVKSKNTSDKNDKNHMLKRQKDWLVNRLIIIFSFFLFLKRLEICKDIIGIPPPLQRWWDGVSLILPDRGKCWDFFIKKDVVGKIEACLKKRGVFSVCFFVVVGNYVCVCFDHLQHFYQHFLGFPGRT